MMKVPIHDWILLFNVVNTIIKVCITNSVLKVNLIELFDMESVDVVFFLNFYVFFVNI